MLRAEKRWLYVRVWAGACVGRSMIERMLSGGEINEEMVSEKERKEKRKEASRVE